MTDWASFAEALKGYGGYTTTVAIIVGGLLTWWRVLPALIDAMANRQSKIEERMGNLLTSATERFARDIEAADRRHDECIQGQEMLRKRIDQQDHKIREQQECIDEQQTTIEALKRQITQLQRSAVRTKGQSPSPLIEAAMASLDRIPSPKRTKQ